jgi:hypothetical protein
MRILNSLMLMITACAGSYGYAATEFVYVAGELEKAIDAAVQDAVTAL